MSTNDLILLNQLLDQRLSEIGEGLSEEEYFEVFSAEQALKDEDLSYDELVNGVIDGGGDGGIDSIYLFINDMLYDDDLDINSFKRSVTLRLVMIQSKTSSGFSETGIEKLISSARDLFDLSKNIDELNSVYNQQLLSVVCKFRECYLALASKFPNLSFHYAYATKGLEVHQNVDRKVEALKETIEKYFTPVSFSFKFFTASALLQNARRKPCSTSSLRLAENPISTGQEGFVCLVAIKDYLEFITDDSEHIRSHLFEGNVRDYQGKTEVNMAIHTTLEGAGPEDFWWLNNGVSIICSNASLSGKTLTIEDAEIVNGLQTSREIFNTLQGKDVSKEPRNVLVRVLKPQNQESRDRIIKATNSQTPIPPASLRATDKIHRDIEDYLYTKGFFYDRRKNYYKNLGKPIRKILSIPFLAQSVLTCALADPTNARARPSSLIKSEDAYKKIFNTSYPLDLYYKCPLIVMSVEDALRNSANTHYKEQINNLRFYVAAFWAWRACKVPKPSVAQVANINIAELTEDSILLAADEVWKQYCQLGASDQVAKSAELNKALSDLHKQQMIEMLMEKKKQQSYAEAAVNDSLGSGS